MTTESPHERIRPPYHVWVKYEDRHAVKVDATNCRNVAELIKVVKDALGLDAPQRFIYLYRPSKEDGSTVFTFLDLDITMVALASFVLPSNSLSNPLIVQVLLPESLRTRTLQPTHDPRRLERWEKLNTIFLEIPDLSVTRYSTDFANVTWRDVDSVLTPADEADFLSPMEIPEAAFKILSDYTSFANMSFYFKVNESPDEQRLHFVAPILVCVCNLFQGEVKISADVHVSGDILRAHGRLDFVLKRGNKRVFVVEAKKQFLPDGMTRALLACEVAADVEHVNEAFGIVTTYDQWVFIRNSNDRSELQQYNMNIKHGLPSEESLKAVSGMIYAMLSD